MLKRLLLCCLALPLLADEGMWPFNQFPTDAVNQKYKFEVTADFLDNLRLASVRIANGSGSFVSPNGLLLTNQHLISECLSQQGRLKDGFYAPIQTAELPCSGLQADVLMRIEDVTQQVKSAAKDGTPAAQAVQQRNAAMPRIEKECADKSGSVCQVLKLFSGGRYDLYQYKRYTDLRLVFAPEEQLAFFGREHDSITYLRYGLDVAFLRAYENGKPAATPHYLKWSSETIKDGDLVFAVGNPAATSRLATAAQLAFYRDTELPFLLNRLQSRLQAINAFISESEANKLAAQPILTPLLAAYKLAAGKLIGLRDDRLVARKTTFEGKVRRTVERDPKLGMEAGKVWDEVATAHKNWTPFERAYQVLEGFPAPGSTLFRIARSLVRGESAPDSGIAINQSLEITLLTQYLDELKTLADRGEKEVPAKAVLNGKTPRQAAEAFVKSSKLADPAERRKPANSEDGMIHLAQLLDPPAKKLGKKHEEMIESLETSASEKIAQYRFKLFGAAEPPDATATPRIEFGVVKGYIDRAGIPAPYAATFSGLYYRKYNQGPYQVPQRWVDSKDLLNPITALDFVTTSDIGGGDHGGPVVNQSGELIGVTFDGNLESLPDTYLYTDENARAVHVSAQGIAESLDKVYKASALLQELHSR